MALEYLFDADSFLFVRKLSILEFLRELASSGAVRLHLTRYVAWQELNSVQDEMKMLEDHRTVEIHEVRTGTEAFKRFKNLWERRHEFKRPIHKGECEEVAWISVEGPSVALVSGDRGARDLAQADRIRALDICDLMCELVETGLVSRDAAAKKLDPWINPNVGLGRPKNYPGFDVALERWRQRQK